MEETGETIILGIMWPWQAFDWGVFWTIIAAGVIYLFVENIFHLLVDQVQKWGERAP